MCSATDDGTYSFLCPSCRLIVNKPAEQRVVELLVSAGDDLLAFHFELDSDDWLEQVITGGGTLGSR
jgi:hypothetical protein